MNLQGHGPSPATNVPSGAPTPVGHHHKHHQPVTHHKHHQTHQVRKHHVTKPHHKGHKSAPRGSLPVTEMVQAMLWHVSPAAC